MGKPLRVSKNGGALELPSEGLRFEHLPGLVKL